MNSSWIAGFYQGMVSFAADNLLFLMVTCFFVGVGMRMLVYYTVRRELWFIKEFEKRTLTALSEHNYPNISFFNLTKSVLQKTYFELFELRHRNMRRRYDQLSSVSDRAFLVKEGAARVVMDFLRQARYLRRDQTRPTFINLSKTVFEQNPVFGRLFGIISISQVANLLHILPNLFVIGGILGTFVGIMSSLPSLGGMDVADPEATKNIMNGFLTQIAFAMNTSIAGIIFSVLLTLINSIFSHEGIYYALVNKFTSSIEVLWNKADNNDLYDEDLAFVEACDRVDLEATQTLKLVNHYKLDHMILTSDALFERANVMAKNKDAGEEGEISGQDQRNRA